MVASTSISTDQQEIKPGDGLQDWTVQHMHLAVRMVPLIRLAGLSRPQLATGSFCVFQAISCTTGIHKKVPLILIAHRYLIYHILSHSLTWVTRVVGNHFSLGKSRHIVIWSDFLSLDSGPGPSRPRRARAPVERIRARQKVFLSPCMVCNRKARRASRARRARGAGRALL